MVNGVLAHGHLLNLGLNLVAQAALATSGNATDSYGLFWQGETTAPFQAFVAGLNNATGLHNRYRARTMVGGWVPGTPRAHML